LFDNGIEVKDENYFLTVLTLVKERCTLLTDFYEQAGYFFIAPSTLDVDAVKPKWSVAKHEFFIDFIEKLKIASEFTSANLEIIFKELATEKNIKPGELQLPMRIMLVGAKFGPGVFDIASTIGKDETIARIEKALEIFKQ
jgi:glutamyl-tRNA synthetase